MIAKCEYCRQISDGLECRKCGAPLPRIEIEQQIEIVIPEDFVDWSSPGGSVMVAPEGRVDMNKVIALAQSKCVSTAEAREMLGIKDSEVRIISRDEALLSYGQRRKIDEIFPYPAWLSRGLVQWRTRA